MCGFWGVSGPMFSVFSCTVIKNILSPAFRPTAIECRVRCQRFWVFWGRIGEMSLFNPVCITPTIQYNTFTFRFPKLFIAVLNLSTAILQYANMEAGCTRVKGHQINYNETAGRQQTVDEADLSDIDCEGTGEPDISFFMSFSCAHLSLRSLVRLCSIRGAETFFDFIDNGRSCQRVRRPLSPFGRFLD